MKTAIVLLTWQRIPALKTTLNSLNNQTHKDFDVYVSNANLDGSAMATVDKYARFYGDRGLRINVSHDGNDIYAFRRFTIGKKLYDKGYEVVMFIDDDVKFPTTYVEGCLSQYEPKTYKSGFAWTFFNKGSSYYKYRERLYSNSGAPIHYCGTGIGMVDASIFNEKGLFDAPKGAYKIEDLWLSYYAQHVMGWKLMYMETPKVVIGGADSVALFKQIQKDFYNKNDFLRELVKMGWNIPD
jgi:hypothetical protein